MPALTDERRRELRARRKAKRQGLVLRKSRTNGSIYRNGVYEGENIDDRGGWMIIDPYINGVVAGQRFDLMLDDVEAWLEDD